MTEFGAQPQIGLFWLREAGLNQKPALFAEGRQNQKLPEITELKHPFIPGSPSRNDVLMALQPCDLSTGNYALFMLLLRRMKKSPATPEPSNNTVPGTGTAGGSLCCPAY